MSFLNTDQAQESCGHVTTVLVAITGNGMVNTSGCGIELKHAAGIPEEIKRVTARLEAFAAAEGSRLHALSVTSVTMSGYPVPPYSLKLPPTLVGTDLACGSAAGSLFH